MLVDRVRVPTSYPCRPDGMVRTLTELVRPLPPYDRVSAGFPGMVRGGLVLSAPHFVTVAGPGSTTSADLEREWDHFDLAGALAEALGKPARVVNDADMQGAAVVEGVGLELVITLGTGFGTAVFHDGRLAPHLEIAHQRFRKGETYDEQLGDAARKRIGEAKWNTRVEEAVKTLDALLFFDRVHIGGGNSRRVTVDLGPKATIVDNSAGILGGIKLWDRDIV